MKKRFYLLLPLLAVLLGLFSCSQENKLDEQPLLPKEAAGNTVLFSIEQLQTRASQTGTPITTQALAREKQINSIYVVVFDKASNSFYKTFQATTTTPAGTYKFDMGKAGNFKLYFVANPDAGLIQKLQNSVTTENDLASRLATQTPGEGETAANFLMTGMLPNITTTASTPANAGEVRLTRAAARFDFYSVVKGLKMTKIVYKNRANQTRFATPTGMTGIPLAEKAYDLTTLAGSVSGKYDHSFIGAVYGYENTNVGATRFTLEGTYQGQPITPQEITIRGLAVKRNYLYSIVIREGKNGTWTPGSPGNLQIDVIVNDWNAGSTIEWNGTNLINTETPSFTVAAGTHIVTVPAASGSVPATNPTEIQVNQSTATDVTINVESAASASSKLEAISSLPSGYSITPGPIGHSGDKLTQTFTIHLDANTTSTEKSLEFRLSNVFDASANRTFTVKQRGKKRPKMAIEYVAEYNVSATTGKFATDNSTTGSGYYTWEKAKTACPPGYKIPSKEEWAGIFPYDYSYVSFESSHSSDNETESIAVQSVNGGVARDYTADYRNKGGGISYALRFKGHGNTLLAAYRYERLGTFAEGSHDSGIKVTVRYLGDSFVGDVNTIAKETYWSSNTGDDVSREFPACGYSPRYTGSGDFFEPAGSLGTEGYYWTSSQSNYGYPWYVNFSSSYVRSDDSVDESHRFSVRPFKTE